MSFLYKLLLFILIIIAAIIYYELFYKCDIKGKVALGGNDESVGKSPGKLLIFISGIVPEMPRDLQKCINSKFKNKFKHIDQTKYKDSDKLESAIVKELKSNNVIVTGTELCDDEINIAPICHIHVSAINYKDPIELIRRKQEILECVSNIDKKSTNTTGGRAAIFGKFLGVLGRSRITDVSIFGDYESTLNDIDYLINNT